MRPVEDMNLSREVVLVTVSGSGIPIEIRQIVRMAKEYDWWPERTSIGCRCYCIYVHRLLVIIAVLIHIQFNGENA
uniref:Uncharacterized protein n=1 Tax=Euplotes raikovi TaxID=5938 RepID=A0A0A0V0T7_EUPRA|nr:hypothetical protein [Euplotes raikovi]